jgi:hypothetical protein
MSKIDPICPTGCDTLLPQLTFDICAPDTNYGQIERLFIRNVGAGGLLDWTVLTEWNTYLSNTSLLTTAIRYLYVIGSKAAPDQQVIDISLQRKVYGPKKHVVNIRIDETAELNYEFLRTLECNGTYLVWYTAGKYMYGGNDGIEASLNINDIIPESTQELNVFEGTIEWEYQFHPEREDNIFV